MEPGGLPTPNVQARKEALVRGEPQFGWPEFSETKKEAKSIETRVLEATMSSHAL